MLNKTTMFDAAVSYARKGISVFPCKPREKIPATKNGFYDATTDEDAIREWWRENPDYNVAIRTGKDSGLVVVDIDEGGEDAFYNFMIPPTVTAKTSGNRFHAYFKHPGFDVRNKEQNTVRYRTGLERRRGLRPCPA
jgi:hypothetical protein